MSERKVLLVGLGQIAVGYDMDLEETEFCYTHARAFTQHKDFILAGGVDIDEKKRKRFTDKYSVASYENIDNALEEEKPNIVVICTPTKEHASTLKVVANFKSVEAIVCEKPISFSIEEAEKMVEECKNNNVKLYINYMRRSESAVKQIKSRIERGEIRKPIKAMIWYSKGFFHNGSHFMDLLKYWLGPVVKSKLIAAEINDYEKLDYDVDAYVEFQKGKGVFMSCWESAYSHYTVELICQNGRLRYEQGGHKITWEGISEDKQIKGYKRISSEIEHIESTMKRYQYWVTSNLAEELANDVGSNNILCTGEDAIETLYDMHKIIRGKES